MRQARQSARSSQLRKIALNLAAAISSKVSFPARNQPHSPCLWKDEPQAMEADVSIGLIILIILVIALIGGFSGVGGGPFYGTGYYGGGGLGLIIIVLLVLILMGRL